MRSLTNDLCVCVCVCIYISTVLCTLKLSIREKETEEMGEKTRTEGEDKQRLFYKEIELVISMEERERRRIDRQLVE